MEVDVDDVSLEVCDDDPDDWTTGSVSDDLWDGILP